SFQMRTAMGLLALLATVGGFLQIPKVTHVLDSFLEPTFADVPARTTDDSLLAIGLILGAVLGLAGIAIAYRVWVQQPGTSAKLLERFRPVYTLFVNKWYFDEAIDLLVVRPFAWTGRAARNSFERIFVNGALVGGTTGVVRASSSAVRAIQTGLLRSYAALFVIGVAGIGIYFLVSA
ncbi:MAG: nuoL, partial [Solirubrobacterales bacterium]|nr:nuoL [Solirubrobacterales bacterium]